MRNAFSTSLGLGACLLLGTSAWAGSRTSLNTPSATARAAAPAADGTLGSAILSAAINADGTIDRGEGVTVSGTDRISTGTYEVAFARDITQCAYSVTAGEAGIGSAVPALTGVTRRAGNPNGVFIITQNPADRTSKDNPFYVLVYCGR